MNTPLVSVLMPNYNCEKYIWQAIESILGQTFTDFEFIIIDDGSTDKSWDIVQEYAKEDKRIIAIRNKENLKICKTLNKWLELAKWKYIARMDSDDIAKNEWLGKVYNYISQNPDIWVCGSNFEIINDNWKIVWKKEFPENNNECKESIWYRNPFAHNSVIIRKEAIENVWWYDEDFVYAEDLELWIRVWKKYNFHNIQENLIQYRIFWDNSILSKQRMMIKNTLKARKKAIKLWYKIPLKWRFFYIWTWWMQFLPPKFVLWLFNKIQNS